MASNASKENNIPSVLLSYIKDYFELGNSANTINPIILSTFKEVLGRCRQNTITKTDKLKIDSVVDYINEELHMGHWSNVPLATRKAYYASSFVKAIILLQLDNSLEALQEALKCIDVGILLGVPLENNRELLTNSAKYINEELTKKGDIDMNIKIDNNSNNINNKRKHDEFSKFNNLNGTEVVLEILPPLECFITQYYDRHTPVKIRESINHWPAVNKWPDISYILSMAGERTVPIEIGSQYSDENWSQKLMTLKEFIEKYYLGDNNTVGYLAQHNLLDQIPELKNDIHIPEYCYTSRNPTDDSPSIEINAWFGPKGTISSLHYDPKDNLLAQVYGTKLILMFSPSDSQYLYPHQDEMLRNTSRINPMKPDLDQFPMVEKAKMFKCLLEPGDVLYIPPKWWHYVVALEKSFSVNFWWT